MEECGDDTGEASDDGNSNGGFFLAMETRIEAVKGSEDLVDMRF